MTELHSLLAGFKLSEASLEKQCCDSLFLKLMIEIPGFENAAPYFGFTQPELRHDYNRERCRKLHMLWSWKRKNGSNATYLAIVKIFLEMNDRQVAELALKHYCEKQLNHVPHIDSHVNPARVSRYQNWDNMTKFEQEKVKNNLLVETQCIRKKFSFLADEILNSLEKNNVEVDRLKFFLANYGFPKRGMNTTILSKFENATTLAGVLLLMHMYYSSWFNIQLFKDVVEKFGNDDDQRKFKVYEECELVPYLHRSIFEIPSKSFGPAAITTGLVSLHLYLPDDAIPTGQDVAVIRRNLCQLLDIADGILQFIGYKEGSIILIFGVPEALLHIAEFETSIGKNFAHSVTKKIYSFNGDLIQLLPPGMNEKQFMLDRNLITVEDSCSSSQDSSQEFDTDVKLTDEIPTMSELMNVVAKPLGTDWPKLGLALGLDQTEDLNVIELENFGIVTNCCHNMFVLWKQKCCSPYRWSTLDQALRSKNVQKKLIADNIHKRRSQLKIFSDMYNEFAKDEPSLACIMEYVGCYVEGKWKAVGVELGLESDVLDSIERSNHHDPSRCMTQVFVKWKEMVTKPYTWQTILVALCMPFVHDKECAKKTADILREKKKGK